MLLLMGTEITYHIHNSGFIYPQYSYGGLSSAATACKDRFIAHSQQAYGAYSDAEILVK